MKSFLPFLSPGSWEREFRLGLRFDSDFSVSDSIRTSSFSFGLICLLFLLFLLAFDCVVESDRLEFDRTKLAFSAIFSVPLMADDDYYPSSTDAEEDCIDEDVFIEEAADRPHDAVSWSISSVWDRSFFFPLLIFSLGGPGFTPCAFFGSLAFPWWEICRSCLPGVNSICFFNLIWKRFGFSFPLLLVILFSRLFFWRPGFTVL